MKKPFAEVSDKRLNNIPGEPGWMNLLRVSCDQTHRNQMRRNRLEAGLATQITWATTFAPDALRLTRGARDDLYFELAG